MSIILAVVITWSILACLYVWKEEARTNALYDVLTTIICCPVAVVYVCYLIISYPIIFAWKFFRNAVKGVSADCWARAKIKKYWKCGNFYFCYDEKARALENKVFLVRVVKPADTIKHEPIILYSDKPSAPAGEFR